MVFSTLWLWRIIQGEACVTVLALPGSLRWTQNAKMEHREPSVYGGLHPSSG